MSLIPRNTLFDLDPFFDRNWSPFAEGNTVGAFSPRIDMTEDDNNYTITAELPGVKKDDINVTLKNGVLSIDAEIKQENKAEQDNRVIRQERRYGKFIRRFELGTAVQESDITADFENGLLTLKAPKAEHQAPETKKIMVR